MDKKNFIISPAPHIHSGTSTARLMYSFIFSLLPCVAAGVYFFGIRSLSVISVCVITALGTEYVFLRFRRAKNALWDGSAFITGLLLALTLPPGIPFFGAFLGSVVAILIGKQIFGGLGYNIFNPALVGRAFLMASFPAWMTSWVSPIDGKSCATPLALGLHKFGSDIILSYKDLFFGNTGGCIGETSAAAVIIGGIFLISLKVIDWKIPVLYNLIVYLFTGLIHMVRPELTPPPLWHILSGGLLFGSVFMATDLVTTPITGPGRSIFAVGCGILVVVIRQWGGFPEGVMYSILIMNALTPLINRFTRPKIFG